MLAAEKLLKQNFMNTKAFKNWLKTEYVQRNGRSLGIGTQVSRVANCSTVEQIEGDLDEHFHRDGMRELIERLSYSSGSPIQLRMHGKKEQFVMEFLSMVTLSMEQALTELRLASIESF